MDEQVFTALGRNPTLEQKGFAGVTWKDGDRTYSVWLNLIGPETWPTFLPRVFEWAGQASEDLNRKDGNRFFDRYFLTNGEILVAGLQLQRKCRESSLTPLDDIETDTVGLEEEATASASD